MTAGLRRPGVLRRAAAGAYHVPAGLWLLLRRPRLWPLCLGPVLLLTVSLLGGFALGLYLVPSLERLLVPDGVSPLLGFAISLALGLGTLAAGMALGLALALLLSAPLLEALTRRVEREFGAASIPEVSLRWELLQSFRCGLYFVVAAPIAFLLSLLPLVGPTLGLLWGAYALAFQQTDWALTRRGFDFAARRSWHRQWRAESLGFGLAGMITLVVPLANLLLAPALAVGGTLLVRALEEEAELAGEASSPE